MLSKKVLKLKEKIENINLGDLFKKESENQMKIFQILDFYMILLYDSIFH